MVIEEEEMKWEEKITQLLLEGLTCSSCLGSCDVKAAPEA
jgi:hypothetical protein